ncbi:LADA_0B04764g1_1 [Lachancea dasiensis]|uniref:Kinesin-like protein n=1 Tax=Lachancea dasiensis TaxID=1072105 RepID=A0A1G4ISY3_9SACH|nr:LADA_0B04764g1_1 [Lachancea dasiensis]
MVSSDGPCTPTKNRATGSSGESNGSRIPSPSAPGSPKYRKRSATQKHLPVTPSEHWCIVSHTKQDSSNGSSAKKDNHADSAVGNGRASSEGSSHMTAFYRENIRVLNELQDVMFQKKAKLDLVKDELMDSQDEHKALVLKLETYKEEKHVKSQQLKLKVNDIKKLTDEHAIRGRYLRKGHELEIQQLRAKNVAEMNTLENEYRQKIEELRFAKIKKLEESRENLTCDVSKLKAQLTNNDETLRDMLSECELRHGAKKEERLRKHQEELNALFQENSQLNDESKQLKDNLTTSLNADLHKKIEHTRALEVELQKSKEKLESIQSEKSQLEDHVKTLSSDTIKSLAKRDELEQYIVTSRSELEQIEEILIKEETMRRKLNNELQELRGKIRVFCRLRPLLKREEQEACNINIEKFNDNNGTQNIIIQRDSKSHRFTFDRVFDHYESNNDVFNEIGPLVQSSLDGYNVCIFAFGQTGSGKTYTMLNPDDGVIPATLNHIFHWIEKLKHIGWNYDIWGQFVEIYNENIRDLLKDHESSIDESGDGAKLEIRHDNETRTTTLTNATSHKFQNREMVNDILTRALRMRSTAATMVNSRSSRSHSVFIIKLHGHNTLSGEQSTGTLNLVDLAGSERVNSGQPHADRLRETQNINKSLSCLGDVIHALGSTDSGKRHIPFRNSKLTYLLQYSLTGESKTLMFVNISPSLKNGPETLNSLRFAAKVNSTTMTK